MVNEHAGLLFLQQDIFMFSTPSSLHVPGPKIGLLWLEFI